MPQARAASGKSSEWQGSSGSGRGREAFRQGGTGRESGGSGERGQGQSFASGQGGNGHKHKSPALNMAASTLRGLGQFYDMQAATARLMLRAQVRAASAFGLPDYSRIFDIGDDRARHLFSTATENLVNFVGQEEEILNEVPTQVFRMMEQQAIDATERWKYGLEELEHQATESVEELRELSRRQAEEFAQASESFVEAAHETMRESGEQYRAAMRQSSEAMQGQGESMQGEAAQGDSQGKDEAEEGSRKSGERTHRGSESKEGSQRTSRSRRAA